MDIKSIVVIVFVFVSSQDSVALIPNSVHNNNNLLNEKFVFIDSDPGLDDAWAILQAVAAHRARATTGFRIVGFSTVCGNAAVRNVSLNLARVLHSLGEKSIPIYEGSSEFLVNPFNFIEDPPFFGVDGFGDSGLSPMELNLEKEHAVSALIRLAEEYKGKLIVIALGPLTNLALAVKLKPEIGEYIKEVYILGGNKDGAGNAKIGAEFNFLVDPEAADVTLSSYRQIKILPLETFMRANTSIEFRTKTLRELNTTQVKLMDAIEAKHLQTFNDQWVPVDSLIMACAINSNIIQATEKYFARVELTGMRTRGMLVLDKLNVSKSSPNVELITQFDMEIFLEYLVWSAGGQHPSSFP